MKLAQSPQNLMTQTPNSLDAPRLLITVLLLLFACGDDHQHDHDDHGHGTTLSNACVIQSPMLSLENGIEVTFTPPPEGIPLNELFTLGVKVLGASSPEELTIFVDATMPAHGHGMLTMVDITSTGEVGRFDVAQMNLHMPGEWALSILVTDGDVSTQGRSVMMCSER